MMCLNKLPDEILMHIFGHLPAKDLGALVCTCREQGSDGCIARVAKDLLCRFPGFYDLPYSIACELVRRQFVPLNSWGPAVKLNEGCPSRYAAGSRGLLSVSNGFLLEHRPKNSVSLCAVTPLRVNMENFWSNFPESPRITVWGRFLAICNKSSWAIFEGGDAGYTCIHSSLGGGEGTALQRIYLTDLKDCFAVQSSLGDIKSSILVFCDGNCKNKFTTHYDGTLLAPNGKAVLIRLGGGAIPALEADGATLYTLPEGQENTTLRGVNFAFSPDGEHIAALTYDQKITIFTSNGEPLSTVEGVASLLQKRNAISYWGVNRLVIAGLGNTGNPDSENFIIYDLCREMATPCLLCDTVGDALEVSAFHGVTLDGTLFLQAVPFWGPPYNVVVPPIGPSVLKEFVSSNKT